MPAVKPYLPSQTVSYVLGYLPLQAVTLSPLLIYCDDGVRSPDGCREPSTKECVEYKAIAAAAAAVVVVGC